MTNFFSLIAAVLLLLLFLVLAGCGQSGPLYIPGNPSSVQAQPGAPEDAEDAADEGEDEENENGAPR